MGITYQTSNRLRRKVMTAPLTLPVAAPVPVAASPAPRRRQRLIALRPLVIAAGTVAAVLIAARVI